MVLMQNLNLHQKNGCQSELGKWWFWKCKHIITNNGQIHHENLRGSVNEKQHMLYFDDFVHFCVQNHLFCGWYHLVQLNKANYYFQWDGTKNKNILYIKWTDIWGSIWHTINNDETSGTEFCIVIFMDFWWFFIVCCKWLEIQTDHVTR